MHRLKRTIYTKWTDSHLISAVDSTFDTGLLPILMFSTYKKLKSCAVICIEIPYGGRAALCDLLDRIRCLTEPLASVTTHGPRRRASDNPAISFPILLSYRQLLFRPGRLARNSTWRENFCRWFQHTVLLFSAYYGLRKCFCRSLRACRLIDGC